MVGLGRLELPTSPLSGVRSSHLSYRPGWLEGLRRKNRCAVQATSTGGAGRDRTGDLLNANQALSQLSYSPPFLNPAHNAVSEPLCAAQINYIEADWTQTLKTSSSAIEFRQNLIKESET